MYRFLEGVCPRYGNQWLHWGPGATALAVAHSSAAHVNLHPLSEHDAPAVSGVGPGVTIAVVHGSRGCLIADIRGVMPTGKDKQPVHRTHPPLDLVWYSDRFHES